MVVSATSPFSALLLILGLVAKAVLYAVLRGSSSALTPVLTVFPRNLGLLATSSTDGLDLAYRQRLTQLGLVYLAGICGALWLAKESRASPAIGCAWERSPTEDGKFGTALDDLGADTSFESPPMVRGSHRSSPSPSDNPPPPSWPLGLISVVPFLLSALVPPLSALSQQDSSTLFATGGEGFSASSSLYAHCRTLPWSVQPYVCPLFRPPASSQTVDIVIAYYDEEVSQTERDIYEIRRSPHVASKQHRVVLYNKGPHSTEYLREKLALAPADEIVPLPNLGREGATYLSVSSLLVRFPSSPGLAPLLRCF